MPEGRDSSHPANAQPSTDRAALATLAANHRALLRFVERRVGNRATAEDILQTAFVKASDRTRGLRRSESALPWFHRVLHNAVVDYHRRRAAERRALERAGRRPSLGAAADRILPPLPESLPAASGRSRVRAL